MEQVLRVQQTVNQTYQFDPVHGVFLCRDGFASLKYSTHVLVTVPPLQQTKKDGVLAHLADELVALTESGNLKWLGYLSTTGVYGDWGGAWVDEHCEPRPTTDKLAMRREAEIEWEELSARSGLPLHIFRLGGLYGPGRSALDVVRQAGPASDSQRRRMRARHTARCHVADACAVLEASMGAPAAPPPQVYNVVDDDPAPRREVVAYAGRLLAGGGAAPARPIADGGAGEEAAGGGGGKRVSNRKIKEALGVELRFPSYREGLAAIASGCRDPFE
eukprot:CAMPEP_0177598968 /NCGR_PEP_ID=MMETSP0419_2-20121207/12703_1 /TAXON_ID=582737 /ORGANISM="Tetraselmis sp., Strain GSL018" /LENGTH=274 /DNA_ID=CAMNT_0019091591 /DNA_START=304 /DNA_END=1128 /DNA_ORIENTATION=+